MATLLVIMMTAFNANAQNACIWGRAQSYNDFINGQYMHNGTINGAPWFTKLFQPPQQTGFDTLYLWRAANYLYYITNHAPINNYSPGLHYAHCSITTNSPWQCGSNWMVYNGNIMAYDYEVYSQEGTCPEWNCDAIDATAVNISPCNIVWQLKVGSNAWSNAAGTTWFYFHPLYFRWLCIDKYVPNSYNIPQEHTNSDPGWIDITKGSSVNLAFFQPIISQYYQYEIKCVEDPATNNPTTCNPTMLPSVIPTTGPTMEPTMTPTMKPTLVPTMKPTLVSTDDPTAVPTSAPTKIPTTPSTNPTLTPSKHPTASLSNNPSVMPSMTPTPTPTTTSNPTIAPTTTPTKNPTLRNSHDPTIPPTSASDNSSVVEVGNAPNSSKINTSMLYIIIGTVVTLIIVCMFCIFACKFWKQRKKNEGKKNAAQSSLNLNNIQLSKVPNSPSPASQNESPQMRKDRNNKDEHDENDEDESAEKLFDAGIDTTGGLMRIVTVSSGMSDDDGDNKDIFDSQYKPKGAPKMNEGDSVEELYTDGVRNKYENNDTEKSSNAQQAIFTTTTSMPKTKRKHYSQWTADEVLVWIFGLDNGKYKKYGNDLRIALGEHGVDGKALPYIEKSEWRSFGITDVMDSHNLEKHVEKLVNGEGREGQNIHDNL